MEEYLFGIDLFNAAFFWEAHESWEAVWHAVERQSVVGHFLQALIQSSAAVLQHHRGRMRGVRNLLERSNANLEAARQWLESRQRTDFMGVELDVWRAQLERHLAGSSPAFPFLRVDSGSAATAPLAPR